MWAAALAVAIATSALVALIFVSTLDEPAGPPRAAIVDQLSLTVPNAAFAEAAAATLGSAGYAVDYYAGEEVTVDFYRDLPRHDYDLIIMRSHAGLFQESGKMTEDVALFTSEPYSIDVAGRYNLRAGRLSVSYYDQSDANDRRRGYFSIPADFVEEGMQGDFEGATVILMGCNVLTGDELARSFIEKGADVVVGWDDFVTAGHTDSAVLNMLEHLLLEDLSPHEAVAAAMAEVGPDPFYNAELVSFPPDN